MLQYLHNKIASSAFVEKDTMEVWVNGIVVETAVSMVFQSLQYVTVKRVQLWPSEKDFLLVFDNFVICF